MLEASGLAGLAAFVLSSCVVGGRLLALAKRTRQLPELLIGSSLVLSGALGTGLSIVALVIAAGLPTASHLLGLASLAVSAVGFVALYAFVWSTFRRGSAWGKALFVACTGTLAIGTLGDLVTRLPGQFLAGPDTYLGPWGLVALVSKLVAYSWGATESFVYWRMMQKRAALGLANEGLVKRFFYWGVVMAAVVGIWLTQLVELFAQSLALPAGWTSLVAALLGFVVAGGLHAAFFRGHVPERSEAGEAGSAA